MDEKAAQMMLQQKRSATEADSLLIGIKAIVFDIEGTTTPITFVKDVLFPYVEDNVEKYLMDNYDEAETKKDITALRELAKKDKEEGKEGVVEIAEADAGKEEVIKQVVKNVRWQMSADRKSTELKQLQGHLWRQAYESGKVKGQLFEDVIPMVRMLSEEGFALYVFSSGSVESQKLLFANTTDGDVTEVFTGFFDMTTGSKTDSESYKKIAKEISDQKSEVKPNEILFLTDMPDEAQAAAGAGWRCALVIRPGNEELTDEHLQNFACIEQFDELYGDEDEEDLKRLHQDDNGDVDEDEDEDDVDEEEEDNEEDEGEGEGDDA